MRYLPLALLLQNTFILSGLAATADEWRSRSIYQLVTDRFALADGSSPSCNATARQYCGGTWQGVIKKLDYIQGMGFDAVWISPVVKNIEDQTAYGQAYHGYWTADINSLNSHFGSADDLKALSDALHKRSMFLMLDVVVNHFAAAQAPQSVNYGALEPFGVQQDFHSFCFISDYNNQTDVEQCWLGDNNVPLPDVDTEDQAVVDTMNNWIKGLVSNYSVDGLRIDTVKHIRKDFWPGFASNASVFTLGEVLINDTNYAAPYTQVIDSVLDYPDYFVLTSAFGSTSGNLSALQDSASQTQSKYKTGAFNTGSFMENQDQPRFQSITQDQALVKNAMTWNFVTDGIPIVYYGQEQNFNGNGDPNNREAFWTSGYDTSKPLVLHATTLNSARKAAAKASSSFHNTSMVFPLVTQNTLAISKPPMLALLSNGGSSSTPTWSVSSAVSGYTPNQDLVDVLSCKTVKTDGNAGISTSSSGGAPMVLLPSSALTGSGLCGSKSANAGLRGYSVPWPVIVGGALSIPFMI